MTSTELDVRDSTSTVYGVSRRTKILKVVGMTALTGMFLANVWNESGNALLVGFWAAAVLAPVLHGLLKTVTVADDHIHQFRPFLRDRHVALSHVSRVYRPMTSDALWIYIAEEHDPVIRIEAQQIDDFDGLIRDVLQRVPETTAIEDPGDRLGELRDSVA